ncbi:glycosyltransferase [Orbaceae bacterium ac157xtp]
MMAKLEKFSVLMSVYIKEKPEYLSAALFSIYETQTLKPDEIVLVEDGTLTNELYSVLDEWEKKLANRVQRIKIPINLGLGKALNEGLKRCQYNLILRMDSDDISLPDRFEKQVTFMSNNPDIVIVGGQIEEFVDDAKNIRDKRNVPLNNLDIIKYAKYRSPFNHPCVSYRKNIIESVGGYQHHQFMEDYNLWIRVLSQDYLVANLPDILLSMRCGDNMIGRRKGIQYIKSEWILARLKIHNKFQNPVSAYFLFFFRASIRLTPMIFLRKIYSLLRR